MTDSRIPVWLDCDPGHDDAFAILLAAYHPGIRLLGISTVFGNASLENTTQNACSILTAIGKAAEIPVYVGASQPLSRPPMHAPTDIHGASGLDGTTLLPAPTVLPDTHTPAIDAAASALRREPPDTAWVVATGAYTNVAALFAAHPDLAPHVRGLSLMGGAVGGEFSTARLGQVAGVPRIGNWSAFAEFNVLADPEAAAALLVENAALAAKTTLVPLDLTHQVLATQEVRELLLYGNGNGNGADGEGVNEGPGKTTLRVMLVELLMFFAKTYSDVFGITEGPPLHDPLAVAAVLDSLDSLDERHAIPFYDYVIVTTSADGTSLPRRERFEVKVVTEGTHEEARSAGARTGQTVVTPLPAGREGVRIPRGLDIPRFWKVLEECVARADEANGAL